MSAEVEIHRLWGGGTVELTFEGRWAYLGYRSLDPDELRRSADEDDARAVEAAYRARRTRALADELERRNAEAAAAAADRKRRRAAATRARNRATGGSC
jgi:hypothetical protein